MVPDYPLDCMSLAEELNSTDVKTNGGLDLDRGGIPELKPKPKAIVALPDVHQFYSLYVL